MTTVTASPCAVWVDSLPRRYRELGKHALFYVLAGGVTTLLQALVYLAMRGPLGPHAANLVAIGLMTVANTEFHRLVTFAGAANVPVRRHLQTLATFGFYAGAGSAALLALHAAVPASSPALETGVLAATSVAGGIIRFLILRSWVFGRQVKMAG